MASTSEHPRVGVVFRPNLPPERLRDFATQAGAAGLDDLWLWEDCFAEGGLTAAAAALAWSGSLRVGLGLMPVPLRNPALAAMEVATVARMFPGRFVPAAGHGVRSWMEQTGAAVSSSMTLLREWVQAVRALLHGQSVTVSGHYVRLNDVALEWPPSPPPPLLVGARGPRTQALAAEVADGVVLDAIGSAADVRQAAARAARGKPYEVVVYLLSAGPEARERAEAELPAGGRPEPEGTAIGSAAEVAATIGTLGRAGATTVVLYPMRDDTDMAGLIQRAADARELSRRPARAAAGQ